MLPALDRAGWKEEQIQVQRRINLGRIRATARLHRQERPLIADYVLEYSDGLPIAVIEARRLLRDPADGFEQVKRYAELLDVPFAYATNGDRTIELDTRTGQVRDVLSFPSPAELWTRFLTDRELAGDVASELAAAPLNASLRNWDGTPKTPRYYQQVAINRAVQAIARGDSRLLLVLATGTGKTLVAAQIVAKLWNKDWPGGRKPRVLYLADRNILVDQPMDEYFQPMFGDAVHKLGGGDAKTGRHIYFALYQSLDAGGPEARLYLQFPSDYFDLVIVDECHRSSSAEGSQWRAILEHFGPAVQIGLTATPISRKDANTYQYFGEPLYEYSLARGIDDGFLAPYRVRRVRMNVDLTGWRPDPGQADRDGREIPDKLYGPREYERVLAILDRTEEAARYLTDYLRRTNRLGKTIVFCENSDHALRMTRALLDANHDLVLSHGRNYACRITARDGEAGQELLDEFRQVETQVPTIAVTARLLTTGVDIPTVRNVVLFRVVRSMPEFKQIIGRGTRLFPEDQKFSFDIIDFVEATRLFNDPAFDGQPMRMIRDETDQTGSITNTIDDKGAGTDTEQVAEPSSEYTEQEGGLLGPDLTDQDQVDFVLANPRRFYVDGAPVVPWGSAFYVYDPAQGGLKLREYSQYVRDQVLKLKLDPSQLLSRWAHAIGRHALREQLAESHITPEDLAEWAGRPDSDVIDLLLYAAWEVPLLSRAERARRVMTRDQYFLQSFAPEARKVLDRVLEQYASRGADELDLAALRSEPYTELGTVIEIARWFGGSSGLLEAMDDLGLHVYAIA